MDLLKINPVVEGKRITSFIKTVFEIQGFKNAVIGMSGGIDSATSFRLLTKSLAPKNIFVAHLYYFKSQLDLIKPMLSNARIPKENIYEISIRPPVDALQKILKQAEGTQRGIQDDKVRLGNIMARARMIFLYDLAKKHQALVCGTENKSEMYLGYFTRFGDEASDIEPIQHLYKTQVYALAKHLNIPQKIIRQIPTAGLWTGQTDEGDFGFSYKQADGVLYLYFEKRITPFEIIKRGFPNAKKIIDWAKRNSFKHHLPYVISDNLPLDK